MKILMLPLTIFAVGAIACGDDATDSDARVLDSDGAQAIDATVTDAGPVPDARPAGTTCQTKDVPVQLSYTCTFEWSVCSDSATYEVSCRIQNVAGNVFSLCDCLRNGAEGAEFISTTICASSEWEQVETIANEQCGWDLI